MTKWRAFIADARPAARASLRALLGGRDGVRVVGEASTVEAAVSGARESDANLVFLDMPFADGTGLDLAKRLAADVQVIFVSSKRAVAVDAFDAGAADFLAKPVDPARLTIALERLVHPASSGQPVPANGMAVANGATSGPTSGVGNGATKGAANGAANGDTPIADDAAALPPLRMLDRLFLRMNDQMGFLAVNQIRAVLADRDHAQLILVDGRTVRVRKPLGEWARRLPDRVFLQIHRSTVINLEQVERVEEWSPMNFRIQLRDVVQPFPMSRRFASRVRARLG